MTVDSIRIPDGLEDVFERAEAIVHAFFKNRIDDPTRGMIEISGERYVLVRAGALSVEFFDLVRDLYGAERRGEADNFARNILFDLAHALGKADAKNFHRKMGLEDPMWRWTAGPPHFAHMGWALVDVTPQAGGMPEGDGERFFLIYDHPYSFEAEAWTRAGRVPSDVPVCIMNSGYAAGWSEEAFAGGPLVASEILCRARGDERCRFIMAPPDEIEARLEKYLEAQPQLAPHVKGYAIPDLFARKRVEDELRRARDELEVRVCERTRELTAANERLTREMAERAQIERQLRQAAKLEAIGKLSGGIAHDFNNLLAVILTRVDLLGRRLLRAERHPELDLALIDVDEIKIASDRATALTRQLLAFSRAQVLLHENLDLNEIVQNLVRTMMPLVGDDIVLSARLSAQVLYVHGDRAQIEQAVMNMVVNARDAMPAGGTLTIETTAIELVEPTTIRTGELARGRYNVLHVVDTGGGMTEDVLSQIFDPFFTTKPPGKGTGLGLSTVYGVVQQSCGGIDVESIPERGTKFAVFFPAAAAGEVTAPLPSYSSCLMPGTEAVLLVEDKRELRRVIAEVLAECGYCVHEAETPLDALDFARTHAGRIDLLLTDVVMPKMGGGELADKILAVRPDIRVLFMSGYAPDPGVYGAAIESGGTLLVKPFRPNELARRVRDMLDTCVAPQECLDARGATE